VPESPLPLVAAGLTRRHRSGRGVREVDLTLRPGEVLALLGPNGSGKTTLLRALTGVDPIDAGSVRWFGGGDRRDPAVRRRLGVVLDGTAHFEEMTGYQNAWFFARRFGLGEQEARSRLDSLLRWADLAEAVHRPVREYSLGMRQRLALVEALAHDPLLLLLDEPTLGLDWGGSLRLIEQIEHRTQQGTAAVLASNDVHLIERLGGRVLFLDEGRIVHEGAVAELLREAGGKHAVELELRAPIPLAPLLAAPGVEGASASGSTVRLLLALDANPAQLLTALDGHGQLLAGMRVRRPDLGDAFLRLTGRSLDAEE
jgi:ABC-2 type transport system ATP-binding protein